MAHLVTPKEMDSVVDSYKLDAITDNTPAITATCLRAAEARVLSYLGGRYDLEAIGRMDTDSPLLADLKEIVKDIALYLILRRHNVDMAYERVAEAYKMHQEYLSKIAGGEISLPGLPLRTSAGGETVSHMMMGSNPKHDFNF